MMMSPRPRETQLTQDQIKTLVLAERVMEKVVKRFTDTNDPILGTILGEAAYEVSYLKH
jgi:hypothetical protein